MSLDSNFFLVLSFSNQWFFQTGFEKNQAKKIKRNIGIPTWLIYSDLKALFSLLGGRRDCVAQ